MLGQTAAGERLDACRAPVADEAFSMATGAQATESAV